MSNNKSNKLSNSNKIKIKLPSKPKLKKDLKNKKEKSSFFDNINEKQIQNNLKLQEKIKLKKIQDKQKYDKKLKKRQLKELEKNKNKKDKQIKMELRQNEKQKKVEAKIKDKELNKQIKTELKNKRLDKKKKLKAEKIKKAGIKKELKKQKLLEAEQEKELKIQIGLEKKEQLKKEKLNLKNLKLAKKKAIKIKKLNQKFLLKQKKLMEKILLKQKKLVTLLALQNQINQEGQLEKFNKEIEFPKLNQHIDNIQKIDKLITETTPLDTDQEELLPENLKLPSENRFLDLSSTPNLIDYPEFLETIPFKINVTNKQDVLEKMGSLKNSTSDFLKEGNFTESKMTQIPKSETALPKEDISNLINDEKEEIYSKTKEIIDEKKKKECKIKDEDTKWMYTGIKGFDELLEKGIPTGANIIVAGGPGCGKTIFCSQAIYYKASEGKDCVFLSMEERPDRLRDHMLNFGFKVEEISSSDEEIILRANGKGRIALKRLQPIRLARSIEALLEKASGTLPVDIDLVLDFIPEDFNACLLALDSISAIETAFSGTKRQYRIYIEQLFRYFEEMNLTTFMITESSDAPHKFSNTGVEEFLSDGIFVFYNFQGVKKRTRGVEIYKLRGASHSQRIVPMQITSNGLIISSDESCKNQA